MKKVPFESLEETRLLAGFFVRQICDELAISERSYYRWKREGLAPKWVLISLNLICGKLDHLGWKGWYIMDGKLFSQHHHPDQYNWLPGELLESRFREVTKTPTVTNQQHAWRNQKRPAGPSTEEPADQVYLLK